MTLHKMSVELRVIKGNAMKINEKIVKLKNGKIRYISDDWSHSYWNDELGYIAGVTTILEQALPTPYGLKQWWKNTEAGVIEQRLEKAKQHGSDVHKIVDQLNQGETVETTELSIPVKKDLASYIEWFREWKPEETESEQILFYKDPDMMFAGTCDLVFTLDGHTVLLDVKTSAQVGLSAFLQVRAYSAAYMQSYGKKIDECLILQLGTNHKKINYRTPILGKPSNGQGWSVYRVDPDKYDFTAWQRIYDTWTLLNDGYPAPPKIIEYPKVFQLFEEVTNKEKV